MIWSRMEIFFMLSLLTTLLGRDGKLYITVLFNCKTKEHRACWCSPDLSLNGGPSWGWPGQLETVSACRALTGFNKHWHLNGWRKKETPELPLNTEQCLNRNFCNMTSDICKLQLFFFQKAEKDWKEASENVKQLPLYIRSLSCFFWNTCYTGTRNSSDMRILLVCCSYSLCFGIKKEEIEIRTSPLKMGTWHVSRWLDNISDTPESLMSADKWLYVNKIYYWCLLPLLILLLNDSTRGPLLKARLASYWKHTYHKPQASQKHL